MAKKGKLKDPVSNEELLVHSSADIVEFAGSVDGTSVTTVKAALEELDDSKQEKIACTTADNGKFLRVVNGAAAWATVPNAEEASF